MSHRFSGSRPFIQLLTIAIATIVALAPGVLVGQSPAVVVGRVTAETGMALMGADVAVEGTQLRTTTDDRGEFRLPGVPAGSTQVRARRLGFRPDGVRINVPASGTETVSITLAIATQDLQPVLVRGQSVRYTGRLAGYYDRLERRTGGVFITREQIERERSGTLNQLLQRTPGITTFRQRDGSVGVRMRDRLCSPLVWLDGSALSSGRVDLDTFDPSTLEGIELYLGSTSAPSRYSWSRDGSNCGTILLWTRGSDNVVPHNWITSPTEIEALVASLSVFTADQVDRKVSLDSAKPLEIPYPPSLYAAHTRGTVVAEFVVDGDGLVERETFGIVSSTHPLFADAVRRAVVGARFTPALKGGKTVRQLVHQPFEFTGVK
jgi:TonB family protein